MRYTGKKRYPESALQAVRTAVAHRRTFKARGVASPFVSLNGHSGLATWLLLGVFPSGLRLPGRRGYSLEPHSALRGFRRKTFQSSKTKALGSQYSKVKNKKAKVSVFLVAALRGEQPLTVSGWTLAWRRQFCPGTRFASHTHTPAVAPPRPPSSLRFFCEPTATCQQGTKRKSGFML